MLKKTILFDLTHNEMLNPDDKEFTNFQEFLKRIDFIIKKNENDGITQEILDNVDLLVLGNPINDFFSSIEIKIVLDFVRSGGGLLLLSEYGSDSLQKTNINDISVKFGIIFQKNIVKEINKVNKNCTSIIHIQNFPKHVITKHLREIVIGGACSLNLSRDAKPLIQITNEDTVWSETYNHASEKWIKDNNKKQILAALTEYGQGKVVAIGDIDLFTSDINIGINAFDNLRYVQNIINWLIEPIKESKILSYILNQIGDIQYEGREINKVLNNVIETMTILEKRITYLEEQLNYTRTIIKDKKNARIETKLNK